jgi:FkbM family methyltransferase
MATLIHLGAGRCPELASYIHSPFSEILLVEPDPILAKILTARIAGHSNVTVRQIAIAAVRGESELRIYNYRALSSLRPLSGLKGLFPGLRQLRSATVVTLSIKDLLQPLTLAPNQPHQIVIDTPGEEMVVVEDLIEAKYLHNFQTIVLHAGLAEHYKDSTPARQILQRLQEQGYDLQDSGGDQDVDRPSWTLRRNDRWQENQQLRAQLQTATERIQALESQHQILSRAHETQTQLAQDRLIQLERHRQNLEEARQRISYLEELDHGREQRQAQMTNEMLKVEGQLDLLKDLIMRDSHTA